MNMRLTFYGGAEEVGRSCFVIDDGKRSFMLDCGIKLGEQTEYPLIQDDELKAVKNLFVTHAHLDHSGYLPHIYAAKARPHIYATKPTRDLAGILLADYLRIKNDKLARARGAGRSGNTKEERGHYKPNLGRSKSKRDDFAFKQSDVDNVMKDMKLVEFEEPVRTHDGFQFSVHNAGHILGSAMVRLEEKGGIIYTGDICMRNTRILDAAQKGLRAHTLIVENTYGSKTDILPSFKESYQKMVSTIKDTLRHGGWVLIPSFAVGRAQEILLALDDYMRSGALPQVKIYMDGMVGKAMRIYRHNAYYANDDIKRRILMSEDDPFNSPLFHKPKAKDKRDVFDEPGIIVTTSGMLTGGPALGYLSRMAGDPKNALIFVGYQAEGTRGAKLLAGDKMMQLGDEQVEVKMRVENVRLSGHADYNEIIQFVKSVKGLKRVFLVHGEKTEMAEELGKHYEVVTPKLLESYGL
jgi:predicted metal-dependent RNase